EIVKLPDVLRQNDKRDMISVIGVNFGTQGYFVPPDDPADDLLFPMVTDRYLMRMRIPFRLDRPIYGWESARKSFAKPNIASGTKIHDFSFYHSWRKLPSILRLKPVSKGPGTIHLNHYQNRAILSVADEGLELGRPDLGYNPVRDEYLNEFRDEGVTYLTPFVKERIKAKIEKGVWKGLKPLNAIPFGKTSKDMAVPQTEPPKLCIASTLLRSGAHRFRKSLQSIVYHMQNYEPESLTYEIIVVGASWANESLAWAETLPYVDRVLLVEGNPSRAMLLDTAMSLCRAKYALSLVDQWETRLDAPMNGYSYLADLERAVEHEVDEGGVSAEEKKLVKEKGSGDAKRVGGGELVPATSTVVDRVNTEIGQKAAESSNAVPTTSTKENSVITTATITPTATSSREETGNTNNTTTTTYMTTESVETTGKPTSMEEKSVTSTTVIPTSTITEVVENATITTSISSAMTTQTSTNSVGTTTSTTVVTPESKTLERRGLWSHNLKQLPSSYSVAVLATAIELLESSSRVLEVWVGDIPEMKAYRNARLAAGPAGLWREMETQTRGKILVRNHLGRKRGGVSWMSLFGKWMLKAAGFAKGKGALERGVGHGDPDYGVFRGAGSVKNLELLRSLGPMQQFEGRGVSDWDVERAFAVKAGAAGFYSSHFCLKGPANHTWIQRVKGRESCSLDPDDLREGVITTGIMARSRIVLNSLWWGEQGGWADRDCVPIVANTIKPLQQKEMFDPQLEDEDGLSNVENWIIDNNPKNPLSPLAFSYPIPGGFRFDNREFESVAECLRSSPRKLRSLHRHRQHWANTLRELLDVKFGIAYPDVRDTLINTRGHRLWISPEDYQRCGFSEDEVVGVKELSQELMNARERIMNRIAKEKAMEKEKKEKMVEAGGKKKTSLVFGEVPKGEKVSKEEMERNRKQQAIGGRSKPSHSRDLADGRSQDRDLRGPDSRSKNAPTHREVKKGDVKVKDGMDRQQQQQVVYAPMISPGHRKSSSAYGSWYEEAKLKLKAQQLDLAMRDLNLGKHGSLTSNAATVGSSNSQYYEDDRSFKQQYYKDEMPKLKSGHPQQQQQQRVVASGKTISRYEYDDDEYDPRLRQPNQRESASVGQYYHDGGQDGSRPVSRQGRPKPEYYDNEGLSRPFLSHQRPVSANSTRSVPLTYETEQVFAVRGKSINQQRESPHSYGPGYHEDMQSSTSRSSGQRGLEVERGPTPYNPHGQGPSGTDRPPTAYQRGANVRGPDSRPQCYEQEDDEEDYYSRPEPQSGDYEEYDDEDFPEGYEEVYPRRYGDRPKSAKGTRTEQNMFQNHPSQRPTTIEPQPQQKQKETPPLPSIARTQSGLPTPDTNPNIVYITSDPQSQYNFLHNSSPYPVWVEGVTYPTAEHYIQSSKFLPIRPDLATQIVQARSVKDAINLASAYKDFVSPDWHQGRKMQVMKTCLDHKFTQHSEVMRGLLGTHGKVIVNKGYGSGGSNDHIKADKVEESFWGVGKDGKGSNWVGRLLMELRDDAERAGTPE
ncbi:hypothetical protein HDU76_000953, partial [Blyttiomyces sp. JEL0837]